MSDNAATTSPDKAPLPEWHACEPNEVANLLETNLVRGLTNETVARRKRVYGSNTITEDSGTGWIRVLARQFSNALIWILLLAAGISAAIGEVTDAATIVAIVFLNGLLGFLQEWKAEKAVKALRQMLSPHCQVIRNGANQTISAHQVVPGDIIVLETGDRIPADLRIADATNLNVDESLLTGESGSVAKTSNPNAPQTTIAERTAMAWMGTAVTNGRGQGIVVATGSQTQFGQIATMTSEIATTTTPLQHRLGTLGRQLGIFAISISVVICVTGMALGRPAIEMLMTGISLAVAVVPEGLPAVVTITLALGIRAMVKRKALLRRLQAAETLGAATVICTDKTGTITQNQMTVQKVWLPDRELTVTGIGYDPAGHFEQDGDVVDYHNDQQLQTLLQSALVCNHATVSRREGKWHEQGEPTEAALITLAMKAWMDASNLPAPVVEFTFSSERKRMTVVTAEGNSRIAHVKGAPEVLLPLCSHLNSENEDSAITDRQREKIANVCEAMARSGLRTLAIARRELSGTPELTEKIVEQSLCLLGIVGIIDPPRPEVPAAVSRARDAGIELVMITGDAAGTALAIANRIGMETESAIEGSELATMSDADLRTALNRNAVFARTAPQHKLRIVKLLQQDGHVVGMTGDGVNDAPALKRADIGIAMGQRGTDVAKGAADMVLTDDNFSSIVDAVEEGRRQYDNIQKFVRYMLSSNTGEAVALFANIVTGGPLILLPVQILWMNLITDGLTALALGLEPAEQDIMSRPPRDPAKTILDGTAITMIAGLGCYVGLATLWLFHHYLNSGSPDAVLRAQTVAFNGIIVIEFFNVLNFRALRTPMYRVGFFSNPWMLAAIATTASIQLAAIYIPSLQRSLHTVPLHCQDWLLIAAVAAPVTILAEATKWLRSHLGST